MHTCIRRAGPAAALVIATVPAIADDPVALPPVEVIGRYENEVGVWDSASQGAVTREGIQKRPLLRPGEVLEAVPGMAVTQHSGDGKANQYFLRGYNLDHGTDFATWVAGMPVNMPTHAHGQGYTDLNFLIPELISRVLYNKGPYFAQDGDFASVGSARIQYVDRLPANVATLTAGSFNYARALFAGSPELGPGNLVYGLEYQYSNGPWENPAHFRKYNGALRYAQGTPANGFNITGMAYKATWNSTDQIAQRAVDEGLVGFFGAIDPTDGGESSRYSLSGEWRQSEGEHHPGGEPVLRSGPGSTCSRISPTSSTTRSTGTSSSRRRNASSSAATRARRGSSTGASGTSGTRSACRSGATG